MQRHRDTQGPEGAELVAVVGPPTSMQRRLGHRDPRAILEARGQGDAPPQACAPTPQCPVWLWSCCHHPIDQAGRGTTTAHLLG